MGKTTSDEVKDRLIDAGGRFSQDLGLGRIVGQMLVYLYLTDGPCSLDEIGESLGLSKASSSIAARQLERLGMIVRVWKKGDRKSYYRTAENFMTALQKGMVEFIKQKLLIIGNEIESANDMLDGVADDEQDEEFHFLNRRVKRALVLKSRVNRIVDNPLVKLLEK